MAWSEAFSIYALILASHYPSRWRNLTLYKLLILCTYCQFQRNTQLVYNRAFRKHAAVARQIGPVSTSNSSIFMLLVLVFDGLIPKQAGVCLPSSAGLQTTGSVWLPLAFATSLIAARFARPTIKPWSAPSTRNRLQPDIQSVEKVIRRYLNFMLTPYCCILPLQQVQPFNSLLPCFAQLSLMFTLLFVKPLFYHSCIFTFTKNIWAQLFYLSQCGFGFLLT